MNRDIELKISCTTSVELESQIKLYETDIAGKMCRRGGLPLFVGLQTAIKEGKFLLAA